MLGGKYNAVFEGIRQEVKAVSWILKNNGKILEDINLDPQTVEEEVLINGAIILDSFCKSVPLIRGLGMNTDRLHLPVNVVEN